MKKTFMLATFFVFALFIGLAQAAQNSEERYYIGIGVSFGVFDKDVLAIGLDDGKEIHNKNGKLNGLVYVSSVLKNSPAEQAGLKRGDILVHTEGTLTVYESLDLEFVVKKIRNRRVGETVDLAFRMINEKGEWVGNTYDKYIPRAKIDSVAWLPMDRVMQSYFSVGGAVQFVVEAKLSENKETGEFTYWHRITNKGKKEVYVQWEVVDKLRTGWWNGMTVIPFKPGESREFVLKSKLLPAMVNKPVRGFEKGFGQNDKELAEGWDFSMSGDTSGVFHRIFGMGANGFIPRRFLKD